MGRATQIPVDLSDDGSPERSLVTDLVEEGIRIMYQELEYVTSIAGCRLSRNNFGSVNLVHRIL